MHSARARRATALGTATIAAVLTAGITALPAHAAGAQLQLFLPNSLQLPLTAPADPSSDPNSVLPVNIGRTGSAPVHDVKVSFDTSALAGVADLHSRSGAGGPGCPTSGAVVTCEVGDLNFDKINMTTNLWLTAAAGVKPGASALLHVTETSSDATSVSQDLRITVGGPDLKVKDIAPATHVKPGSTVPMPIEFANVGQLPTSKVVVELEAGEGLDFAGAGMDHSKLPSNCEYAATTGSNVGEKPEMSNRLAICTLDLPAAVGQVYRLDPIALQTASSLVGMDVLVNVEPAEDAPGAQAPLWRKADSFQKGGAAPLTATAISDDAFLKGPRHQYDRQTYFGVQADNTADFAALGNWAPNGDGTQGTLTVGLQNNGPGAIINSHSGENPADVRLVLPQGVQVTKVPTGCHSEQLNDKTAAYACDTTWLVRDGYQQTFPFGLKLTGGSTAGNARVSFQNEDEANPQDPQLAFDPNPANNAVLVALGAQPAGAPITAVSASAAPSENSTNPADTKDADSGKALAFTGGGSDAAPLAAVGGAVLLAGAGAVLYARRRRTS